MEITCENGKNNLKGRILKEKPKCWGFKVTATKIGLHELIRKFAKKEGTVIIGTSRKGVPITKIVNDLKKKIKNSKKIIVVFGSPYKGIYEILEEKEAKINKLFTFIINFIPDQGVRTVRTEEAMCSTLSILNLLSKL